MVACVPGIDAFRFCLDGAMREHGIIDSTAYDAKRSRAFERIRIFRADSMLARHPGQRGVNLGQTVRSAAAAGFVESNNHCEARFVADLIPVEYRYK